MNIIKASEETWADKFSNPYRPAPLPDQSVKQYGPEEHLITKENILDTRRTSSAPNQFPDDDEPKYVAYTFNIVIIENIFLVKKKPFQVQQF